MSADIFNEDLRIPEKFVGLIIGRGGEKIKKMQMESGCKIRIASDNDGSLERSCTLTGSQMAIDEAKRMIGNLVRWGISREGNMQQGQQQSHF